MKILATRIANEIKNGKLCTVYEPELTRVWPDEKTRPAQIASFAKQHGWQVSFTATDSSQSLIESPLAENPGDFF